MESMLIELFEKTVMKNLKAREDLDKSFKEILKGLGLKPREPEKLLRAAILVSLTNRTFPEIAKDVGITRQELQGEWMGIEGFQVLMSIIPSVFAQVLIGRLFPPIRSAEFQYSATFQKALKKEILLFSPQAIIVFFLEIYKREWVNEFLYAAMLLSKVLLDYKFRKRSDRLDEKTFREGLRALKSLMETNAHEYIHKSVKEFKIALKKEVGEEKFQEALCEAARRIDGKKPKLGDEIDEALKRVADRLFPQGESDKEDNEMNKGERNESAAGKSCPGSGLLHET